MIRIALLEPDIPQNTGTILRLCGCLGVEAHLIEPAGFPATDRAFRRAGMDYLDHVRLIRHRSWEAFETGRRAGGLRLVLFTTQGSVPYLDHRYRTEDILLFGRESAGVPDMVRTTAGYFGGRIGVAYAEPFFTHEVLGLGGLDELV